jgi:class 3 adenylate cyclase
MPSAPQITPAPSALICRRCEEPGPDGARFCWSCGAPFPAPGGKRREERRVVSVLFVDLVGFTAQADGAEPEEIAAVLRPYHARARREIEALGGTVEKFIGDAVVGVFGAPVAHDDHADRAVRAGLKVLAAVEELGLAARAAVNTGEALVLLDARPHEGEGLVIGDVVNTASRLQAAAPAGALLVGAMTHRLTRRAVRYEELVPVAAKGKASPIACWRALSLRPRASHAARTTVVPPFAGRRERRPHRRVPA